MPGFYFPIVLDGVAAIKDSVLSTGWNPVSKIVGFISEDEQITAIQELKKIPNKDEICVSQFVIAILIWKENW